MTIRARPWPTATCTQSSYKYTYTCSRRFNCRLVLALLALVWKPGVSVIFINSINFGSGAPPQPKHFGNQEEPKELIDPPT
ncbi:hypothetical protein TWF706_001005 [Orbilia oligospora]|nr:hypothetical protein TWF706_001005 [Orbilia oligospora]